MADFSWDHANPLTRAKGETKKANAALWDYAQMGPGRSLGRLHHLYRNEGKPGVRAREGSPGRPPTRRLATLEGWSSCYDWQARLGRFEELEREKEAADWRGRRAEWREDAYQLARQALGRLEEMLSWPLSEREVLEEYEDGRPLRVEIVPAKWTMLHVARLFETAHKVASLALGDPTERQEQIHSGSLLANTAAELAALEDAELNDRIRELSEKLDAPGPETLQPPVFRGRPPDLEGGNLEDAAR